ncbi:hypothetical protein [Nocardioides panaciterrulae]|uniref:Putative amino acid dehydrogenase n=1 Tax=Nocardioides panaciterrulae TaxID=661492 RepID=A0A7Y9JAZ6_9ACTN|nr:hypothetical protein [Nocardioides panaciterrulae]NYD42262.1 putative amino acid dehydrogenase [Nocardioides panaciterrulae]
MRLVSLLLCAAVATSACSADDALGSTPDGHARRLQTEFRQAAEDVLPPLVQALGGTLDAMPAYFVGCQVAGLWRYVAQGEVHDPAGGATHLASASRAVLEDQGFEVTSGKAGIAGTRGQVRIVVSRLLRSRKVDFSMVRIDFVRAGDQCENYSDHDDRYAEQATRADYADLVG